MTQSRRFHTLDVFTDRALAGNPLAVVLDSDGLSDDVMLAIAGEFNLSETVFVGPPISPLNRAAVRIFTPGRELPFAGHPTVGTAVLLGLIDRSGAAGRVALILEEKAGLAPCAVEVLGDGHGRAEFTIPAMPQRLGDLPSDEVLAAGLGLEPSDIGFGVHLPAIYSAGVAFGLVPLASREAVSRARPAGEDFARAFAAVPGGAPGAYVYCADPLDAAHAFHARMFAPGFGIAEDPATGSAAAALAGAIMDFDRPDDGKHVFTIEQGDAMGRPSRIRLTLQVAERQLSRARIAGQAVLVGSGTVRL